MEAGALIQTSKVTPRNQDNNEKGDDHRIRISQKYTVCANHGCSNSNSITNLENMSTTSKKGISILE